MNILKISAAALAVFIATVPVLADTTVSDRGDVSSSEMFDTSVYAELDGLDDLLRTQANRLKGLCGVLCLKSDEDIADISALTDERINETVVYVGTASVGDDGAVSVSFRLPSRSGKYLHFV